MFKNLHSSLHKRKYGNFIKQNFLLIFLPGLMYFMSSFIPYQQLLKDAYDSEPEQNAFFVLDLVLDIDNTVICSYTQQLLCIMDLLLQIFYIAHFACDNFAIIITIESNMTIYFAEAIFIFETRWICIMDYIDSIIFFIKCYMILFPDFYITLIMDYISIIYSYF